MVQKWFRNHGHCGPEACGASGALPCPHSGETREWGGPEGLRDVPRATGEPLALWGYFWGWAEPLCGVFFIIINK